MERFENTRVSHAQINLFPVHFGVEFLRMFLAKTNFQFVQQHFLEAPRASLKLLQIKGLSIT